MIASVLRSGRIIFTHGRDPRALPLTAGEGVRLRKVIRRLARISATRKAFFVPGVFMWSDGREATITVARFKFRVEAQLRPHNRRGK